VPPDKPASRAPTSHVSVGDRIHRFRQERGLNLSRLAEQAGVSKGYLWTLENNPDARRPSAETLYAVAKALGVTMADLMGRELSMAPAKEIPDGLRAFAEEAGLPEADIQMLASIQFRGERPRTKERWRYIYTAISTSAAIDEPGSSPDGRQLWTTSQGGPVVKVRPRRNWKQLSRTWTPRRPPGSAPGHNQLLRVPRPRHQGHPRRRCIPPGRTSWRRPRRQNAAGGAPKRPPRPTDSG
jgi:transcriptional regulator with XRE-family HTH domain